MSIDRDKMKALPIQGYLDWQEIPYTKSGHFLRLVDHDSLVINTQRNQFMWNSKQVSGDLGDFIAAYKEVSSSEAWREWIAYSRYYNQQDESQQAAYCATNQPSSHFDWSKWQTSQTTTNSEQYLVDERGFSPKFARQILHAEFVKQGVARQNPETKDWQKPPLLFPWVNEQGQVVGLDQQGTIVDYEKYGKRGTEKKIAAGSNTQYGYHLTTGTGTDKVIVFEAPLDLLSYAQMYTPEMIAKKQNVTLLSLSGTNMQKTFAQLDRIQKQTGQLPKELVLATDKDEAGFKAADVFYNLDVKLDQAGDQLMTISREVPKVGKDWNEQLKAGGGQREQLTITENHQQLTKLQGGESIVQQQKPPEQATEPRVIDLKQNSSAARQQRQARNREKNQTIIKNAMEKVANYQNDPKEVQRYLNFVAQGQNYSPRNTLLIYGQRPTATIVMGYQQFAERGIQVKPGEKGMKIYGAPQEIKRIVTEKGKSISWHEATAEQRHQADIGQLDSYKKQIYPIQTVFDVKQTDAKLADLPTLLPNRPINLTTDQSADQLENIYSVLKKYAIEEQHVKVIDHDPKAIQYLADHQAISSQGIAKGATAISKQDPDNKMIILRPDLPVTDRIATLTHEMGHAALHQTEESRKLPRGVRELQAEMTAYVVLKNIGVEPGDVSEKYMHDWTTTLDDAAKLKDKNAHFLTDVTKVSTALTDYLTTDREQQAKQTRTTTDQLTQQTSNASTNKHTSRGFA